jgi:hypothetical protein
VAQVDRGAGRRRPRGGGDRPRTLALFPEDRCEGVLPDASIVRLKLSQLRLSRARQWGAYWLALKLWKELRLDGPGPNGLLRAARARCGIRFCSIGSVPVDRARSGVAVASRMVRTHRLGRFAGSGRCARGQSQAVPLPRPAAGAQAGGVRSPGGAVAGSVQRLLRRAAV